MVMGMGTVYGHQPTLFSEVEEAVVVAVINIINTRRQLMVGIIHTIITTITRIHNIIITHRPRIRTNANSEIPSMWSMSGDSSTLSIHRFWIGSEPSWTGISYQRIIYHWALIVGEIASSLRCHDGRMVFLLHLPHCRCQQSKEAHQCGNRHKFWF